jgi:hypothetical protein
MSIGTFTTTGTDRVHPIRTASARSATALAAPRTWWKWASAAATIARWSISWM